MAAGRAPRFLLLLAAVAVLLFGSPAIATLCLLPICMTYIAVGQSKLLGTYSRPFLLVLTISALLWMVVYVDFSDPHLRSAFDRLIAPSAPFGLLVRTVVASAIIVLAIGSAPDGADLALARMLGMGASGAILFSGAKSSISVVSESFERSLVALRAHGVIGVGRFGWLIRLPLILQLTWTSCLHLLVNRAEIKWEKNGFLQPGAAVFDREITQSSAHNIYCILCAAAVMLLVLGGTTWR